jgi:hypothetical protein
LRWGFLNLKVGRNVLNLKVGRNCAESYFGAFFIQGTKKAHDLVTPPID